MPGARFRMAAAAGLLFAALSSAEARAGSASGTMPVSLEVAPSCTLAVEPLTFGAIAGDDSPTRSASAAIDVACGPEVPFAIALDGGQHPSDGTRRALDPATGGYVAYDIFVDPARSQRWGPTGVPSVAGVTTSAGTARLTAYGLVAGASDLAAGSYRDVVTVTAVF